MTTKRVLVALMATLSLSGGLSYAMDMADMPKPGPEQAWLQQMVGDWTAETECVMMPGQPAVKTTGTESIRPIGGFWTIAEVKSTMMDKPFVGNMTLGYDTGKKKYVGTWVDSMTGQMWQYEGSVDESGKVLTLESEGECPMNPGKVSKFRETIEIHDNDHKVYTSSILDEKGQWVTMMTSRARRVK